MIFTKSPRRKKSPSSFPVETTGEPAGVKNGGGTLEHILHKLKVRCLPKDLPEQITLDVTALEIGKSIHLGEIVPPAGVEIVGEKSRTVVAVAAPRAEEEVATTEVKAAGDVEMTKEKKKKGAEGAAPAAKGDAKAAAGDKKAEAKPEAKAEAKKK